jgi:hypothetical protein
MGIYLGFVDGEGNQHNGIQVDAYNGEWRCNSTRILEKPHPIW